METIYKASDGKEFTDKRECFKYQIKTNPFIETKLYLHGDEFYEEGEELGLEGKELDNFRSALYEVEFKVKVDLRTGDYKIFEIRDGKDIFIPKENKKPILKPIVLREDEGLK